MRIDNDICKMLSKDIINSSDLYDCKPATTPILKNHPLIQTDFKLALIRLSFTDWKLRTCIINKNYYLSSLRIHSRGFSDSDENKIGATIHELPVGISIDDNILINNLALAMPFWLTKSFHKSDYALFTDSEFDRFSIVKVKGRICF